MADDPDAPWMPGSPVDMVDSQRSWSFDKVSTADEELDEEADSRAPRRLLTAVAVVASLGVVAAIVVGVAPTSTSTTEPTVPPSRVLLPAPDRTLADEDETRFVDLGDDVILAGGDVPISSGASECLHRRLPTSVELRWSASIPDAPAVSGAIAVGSDVVVVPVASARTGAPSSSELVALDVSSGEERWRLGSPLIHPMGVEFLHVVDEVVLVISWPFADGERRLLGLSSATGEPLWDLPLQGLDTVEWVGGSRVAVIRRVDAASDGSDDATSVVDVRTGSVMRFRGAPVSIDEASGLLVTGDDGVVYGQFLDATTPGRLTFGVNEDQSYTPVGESIVMEGSDAGALLRRSLDPRAPISVSPLELSGSVRIDPPERIVELVGLDDASIAVMSDDAVHGANVGERVVEIRWRVAGRLVGDAPNDRGRTLVVRSDGGRLHRLVDSSTGRTIFDASSYGDVLEADDLHANGIVVRDGVGADAVRTAVDLDGRTMWTLQGTGPLAVGDRVVVDWRQVVEEGATSVALSAFGPTIESAPSCATAAESFQGFPP